jgi:glycosyltransferase involved in cell wall biosynthesis
MASGVPVVCSDIPVFREVYGDAVLYVDPTRAESIAAALRALLINTSLSSNLRAGGKKQASKYRGARLMARYIDLLTVHSKE